MPVRGSVFCCLGALVLLAGCPGPGEATDGGSSGHRDLGATDLGCYPNPQTHVEILNACTPAQAVDKTVTLPLLRPDGTLPPLP